MIGRLGASKDRDERMQRKDASKNAAIRWILERVTDDELKSSATHDAEEDMGDYTISSLGSGRAYLHRALTTPLVSMKPWCGLRRQGSWCHRIDAGTEKRLPSCGVIGGEVTVLTASG
jgi:hypothetical protein